MTLAITAKLSVLDSSGGLGYATKLNIWDRALTTKYFSTIFPRNTPRVFWFLDRALHGIKLTAKTC